MDRRYIIDFILVKGDMFGDLYDLKTIGGMSG